MDARTQEYVSSVLQAAGRPARIWVAPYMHAGKQLWTCEVAGAHKHISLTMIPCSFIRLPENITEDEVFPVQEMFVDHLKDAFEKLSQEVNSLVD